jgi:hypothetical protein
MATNNQILEALKSQFPATYETLVKSIDEVPQPFDCLDRLSELVNSYCYHQGMEITHLTNNLRGQKAQAKARQELYAVVVYLVHPIKMYGIKNTPHPEMMQALKNFFSDDYKNVSFHIVTGIGLFGVDKSFKAETIRIAGLVQQDLV